MKLPKRETMGSWAGRNRDSLIGVGGWVEGEEVVDRGSEIPHVYTSLYTYFYAVSNALSQ